MSEFDKFLAILIIFLLVSAVGKKKETDDTK